MTHRFRALLDLCKRRGFLFPSAEIYGGLRGAYDYGPLGVELKNNIQQSWWRHVVYYRDDVVGLDTSILTPYPVLKASGHVDEFTDLLVDCILTKERFRPDKAPSLLIEERNSQSVIPIQAPNKDTAKQWQTLITTNIAPGIDTSLKGSTVLLHVARFVSPSEQGPGSIEFVTKQEGPPVRIDYHGYADPTTNSPFLTPSRPFNLMFKTFLDPIDPIERVIRTTQQHASSPATVREAVDQVLRPSMVYLRPETAQGVFINFEQVARTMKKKPPFGIAQVGKSFRNEIRLEHGIFRTPEFEQLELEYFVAPSDASRWHSFWRTERFSWWRKYAHNPDRFRLRDHSLDEMAHYASGCTDIEYQYPWGWGEVEGVANRGNYDLTQHTKGTNARFEVADPQSSTSYIPHVVESSCGLNRALLAYLCDAFDEVPDEASGREPRYLLRLHPRLAPVKCAVMPLTGNPEFMPWVEKMARSLRCHDMNTVTETQKLKVGKRYYRHDEIGTPWCVTIDYQTLEDNTVTVRERDTAAQHRLHWSEVAPCLTKRLSEAEFPES